jgi:phosphopantothenoylcysteine synthetase/decarboxylase
MEQRHEAQTERPMQREKEEGAEQAQQQQQEEQEQQQEEQEPQPQTPSEFDTYLRNESKNAKEYAEKLQMLPRGIRLPVFDYVRKTDPEFSVLITQHLGLVGGREAPSTGSVDMRPMPQQKPPRRG